MKQLPGGRRLSRKEFLEVVGAGAAGSVALFATAGCTTGPAEVVGSAQEGAQAPPSKKKSGADIKGATDALVTFITTASLRTMPDDVIAVGKRCLIDGFGVILAGSTVQGSAIVRQYVKAVTDKKEASVSARSV